MKKVTFNDYNSVCWYDYLDYIKSLPRFNYFACLKKIRLIRIYEKKISASEDIRCSERFRVRNFRRHLELLIDAYDFLNCRSF